MDSDLLALFLFLPYIVSAATSPYKFHLINLTARIHATIEPTAWYSPSRRFAFGFLPVPEGDGFVVGIWIVDDKENVMVWTANRDNPPVSSNTTVELTGSGKLVLKADSGSEMLIADTSEPVTFASMLDSGNFVLHGQYSTSIWETFSSPTDTILGGQILPPGNQLISKASPSNFSTGRFRLKMQTDGELAAYPSNTGDIGAVAYWSRGPYHHLHLDNAGRLNLVDQYNSLLFRQLNGNYSGDTLTTIYRATLDPDGNFRLYSNASREPLWTALSDACDVKGLCGFNSYCNSTHNHLPSCYCLPGTVNHGHIYDGCQKNFTKQKCRDGKAEISSYNITTMQQIKWEEEPYFKKSFPTDEACKKYCLEDCYCDAAEYDGSSICGKHKYPLRYISMDIQMNSTTYFKVGSLSIDVDGTNQTTGPGQLVVTSKKTWLLILVLTVGLVTYSCVALATFGIFVFKSRIIAYKRLLESGASGIAKELTLRLYSYKELEVVTKGFRDELGKGSFGAVYKGTINNGEKLVAVKRLQKLVEDGEREFQSEMRVIGKTHHKNLVRLLGYCTEGTNRLLVYEYMSNKSLADLLFRSERLLDWHERVRIALDVARGILYLHEECETPIIHCDIKPQNILMDEFWNAKISDFGLAKLLMPDQTRTFTDTRGTRGYLAPEWYKNMPISLKVDVYSYGIVLLEIICCRRSIDLTVVSRPEEIQLSGWAYSCYAAGELSKLVRDEEVDERSLERMVAVAFWCIKADPILRPSMKGVVLMLQGFTNISTPPCPAG
ncbi:hypothetical protein C2S51_032988 [Perilla frutescens var. frutescens]|nr:hypothetical protein C2S51_032988 [Perilla frutescens var. frutescens]